MASPWTWIVQPSLTPHFFIFCPRELCALSHDSCHPLRYPTNTHFPVLFLTNWSNFWSSCFIALFEMYPCDIVMLWFRMVIYCITSLATFSNSLYLINGWITIATPPTYCPVVISGRALYVRISLLSPTEAFVLSTSHSSEYIESSFHCPYCMLVISLSSCIVRPQNQFRPHVQHCTIPV